MTSNQSNLSKSNGSSTEAMIGQAAATAHQAIDSAAGRVPAAVDRAAAAAHGAVDSAAGTARPAAHWAAEKVQAVSDAQEKLVGDTRDRVTAHPLKAIAIAAGIGFLLGRLS
ncbi:MAG TPA: DUF883 C-terminal domain-containing protein [Burkholderiales bacterium]|nr:DUF883 C-terminal domain-containing protein [Burkholderiales bacterium]